MRQLFDKSEYLNPHFSCISTIALAVVTSSSSFLSEFPTLLFSLAEFQLSLLVQKRNHLSMTSPNSILDGRSTDPGSQPQSYVTGQIGRKQKAAYEPENADHKLDSSDFFKVQDPSCLECKKRRLNVSIIS